MLRRFLIFFCVLSSLAQVLAQSDDYKKLLDSTKAKLAIATDDSVKCVLLNKIVDNEFDENIWPKYNEDLLKLALKHDLPAAQIKTPRDRFFISMIAIAYNNRGLLNESHGDFARAIEFLNKSIEYSLRINDPDNLSMSYNNMGGVYVEQKMLKEALEYFMKSLVIRRSQNDKGGMNQALFNISICYNDLGEEELYLEYLKKSLELSKELKDIRRIGMIYNNLGATLTKQRDLETAKMYLLRGIALLDSLGEKRGVSVGMGNLSDLFYGQKDYKLAETYGKKALAISTEQGFLSHARSQSLSLHKIYNVTGNYKEALEYYKLHIKLRDSIESVENNKAAIRQQFQFQYDKQKAIDDANHQNEIVIAEEKEQRQRVVSWSIALGLLMMIVFAVLLFRRLRQSNEQKKIIAEQKHLVEEKQKEILASINYARRIQNAHMPTEKFVKRILENVKK